MPSDALETKIISMLDALQNGVVTVAGQAVKYAPDVMQAALAVTQIDGVQSLVKGVVALIIFICAFFGIYKAWKNVEKLEEAVIVITFIGGGVLVVTGYGLLVELFNVWNYVAIINPKLFIAHQIVQQVLN